MMPRVDGRATLAGMKAQAARTASPLRYCGRSFTPEDLETIRAITEDPRHATRKDIARAVCAALHWVQPDGQPKLVSCHVALQGMEAHGVIWLPLPTRAPTRPHPPRRAPAGEPGTPITGSRGDLRALRLAPVADRAESALWNELSELSDRYHYLGRTQSAGAQCRYLAWDGDRALASLDMDAVIAQGFAEAQRRDQTHRRTWLALVDGNNEQLRHIRKHANRAQVRVVVLLDFIHVLEHLWRAAWCFFDEKDPAAER